MGRWPVFPLLFLVLVLSLSLGCGMLGFGGDSEDDAPMGLIQFDDADPVEEPGAAGSFDGGGDGALVSPVSINPEVLVEIHFLYSFQVRMEGLRQVIRDLNAGLEHSGSADVDLDWVIEVHQVTRESDEFFQLLTSMKVPESQRDQYHHLQIGMLETIQVAGYGADRLLAASVIVGPSGRSMLNMSDGEVDEFETLLRESRFFLTEAESRMTRQMGEVVRAVGGLVLR